MKKISIRKFQRGVYKLEITEPIMVVRKEKGRYPDPSKDKPLFIVQPVKQDTIDKLMS